MIEKSVTNLQKKISSTGRSAASFLFYPNDVRQMSIMKQQLDFVRRVVSERIFDHFHRVFRSRLPMNAPVAGRRLATAEHFFQFVFVFERRQLQSGDRTQTSFGFVAVRRIFLSSEDQIRSDVTEALKGFVRFRTGRNSGRV